MTRALLILVGILTVCFLLLQGRLNERNSEKPHFLRTDAIADAHRTKIYITAHSYFKPDSIQTEMLRKDYSNLWAHLNHLYETNDIETGKEYYTEDWFKQINRHYNGTVETYIKRTDTAHNLHIINWASDGLVCTATDSNIVFRYRLPGNAAKTTKATIAVVLLYQGDHWRIDAMKVLKEETIDQP
jgi:hypothetical protein